MFSQKRLLLTIILIFIFNLLFCENEEEFIVLENNLEDYFENVEELIEKENEELTEEKVLKIYNSTYFLEKDSIKNRLIINSINILPNVKKEYYKSLDYYYQIINYFINNNLNYNDFIVWFECLEFLIKKKKYKVLSFLEQSKLLFKNNILNKGDHNVIWKAGTNNYFFKIRNNNFELEFQNTSIIAEGKNDYMKIDSTKGFYNFNTQKWIGEGGILSWERIGRPDVYVKIPKKYTINFKNSYLEIDSCLFYQKKIFFLSNFR